MLQYVNYTSIKNCKTFENKHIFSSCVHTFKFRVHARDMLKAIFYPFGLKKKTKPKLN